MIQRPPGRDGPLCQGLRLRSGPGRPRPLGLEDLGRQMSSDVGCHRSGLVEFIESRTGKRWTPLNSAWHMAVSSSAGRPPRIVPTRDPRRTKMRKKM